ncbi:IS66 family insertion sequence element accessory protein TnpA [Thiolapillus sp.]
MQNTTNQLGGPSGHKLTEVQRFWLQHYQAWQTSGKNQVAYAREHGLAVKSLYY